MLDSYHDFQLLDSSQFNRATVESEWDRLSPFRANQIREKRDVTFWNVMVPLVNELLRGADLRHVLDVGCGTGELTQILSLRCGDIFGIDLSPVAVSYARSLLTAYTNASVLNAPVEELLRLTIRPTFSAAYANMALMDMIDLDSALKAISANLLGRAVFVFSITHPVYWPRYRGYATAPWFDYHRELVIRAPFKISDEELTIRSTHVHRPISDYLKSFRAASFGKVYLFEPIPPRTGIASYDSSWKYPRYLFGATMRKKRSVARLNAKSVKTTWHVFDYPSGFYAPPA